MESKDDKPGMDQPSSREGTSSEARTSQGGSGGKADEAKTAGHSVPSEKTGDTPPVEPRLIQPATTRWKSSNSRIAVSPISERDFAQLSRRELLRVLPVIALGAFAIPSLQDLLLAKGLRFSDWASAWLFRPQHLASTFSDADLTPFEKFPINDYDVDDPGVIFENWTLTVGGAVQKPGDYTLAQVQTLPRVRHNTRHVCVEGWDVIGRFGGARLSDFLHMIGADTAARFIAVKCADDYYESLDMATALHPQTLLCWEMYDRPLTREHGAPLRLNVPTKIGYKHAKYLTDLKVTNVLDKIGYWEDQGYSEFYGL
jgi:DMSO/TMAO reductase YedYZ molybdopterin-dependent catalytic subunit